MRAFCSREWRTTDLLTEIVGPWVWWFGADAVNFLAKY